MNGNLRKISVLMIFCIAFGFASAAFGQIKTGGYKIVSVEDDEVRAAAEFAVEAKSEETEQEITLEGILKAERQTVAGANYRLCLQLYVASENEPEDAPPVFVRTVVNKSLDGEMKITSWLEVESCGGK